MKRSNESSVALLSKRCHLSDITNLDHILAFDTPIMNNTPVKIRRKEVHNGESRQISNNWTSLAPSLEETDVVYDDSCFINLLYADPLVTTHDKDKPTPDFQDLHNVDIQTAKEFFHNSFKHSYLMMRASNPVLNSQFSEAPILSSLKAQKGLHARLLAENNIFTQTFHDSGYSESKLLYKICSSLCNEVCPPNVNINLKKMLLLSLCSIGFLTHGHLPDTPIPVIAVGHDTLSAACIMKEMCNFSQRLLTTLEDNPPRNSQNTVFGNSFTLASQGVLYLDNWNCLPAAKARRCTSVLESKYVPLKNHQTTVKLDCAIWAHWGFSSNYGKNIQQNDEFTKVFGLPITIDNMSDDDILEFAFSRQKPYENYVEEFSMFNTDLSEYSGEFLEKHLLAVQSIQPIFGNSALNFLSSYITAKEHVFVGSLKLSSMTMLHQIARAHARFFKRSVVETGDVLEAICIAENSYLNNYMGSSKAPQISESVTLVDGVDGYMQSFTEWLQKFLSFK